MTVLPYWLARIRLWLARRQLLVSVAVLAFLAYIPALTAAPGRMPSDSKLYVYLDPGRFLVDTTTTFDPRQYAGWVPHQHIAYLWPTGPWFWIFEQLGTPDWIAHRLWIGTLLLTAGLGVRWTARVLGLGPTAALTAAIVYQLSPYILPYVSRTSVLLLPFAGLGWIVGLTVLAAHRGRWRFSAGVALVVFTVGAVNATALAMIIPAPVLWLVHAVWQGTVTWRRALATAAKVSVLALGVSLWWIVMLMIQGRRGADVLAYSESLESVSFTSTSTEVLRGLGYWLFYIRDAFGATTTASLDHLTSAKIIVAGVGLLALCLLGLVATSWQHRRYAALLVACGTILGVGVHPIDDPSPVMSLLVGDGEGGLALALRSSTRALPVLLLGLGLSAAALVSACQAFTFPRPAALRTVRIGTVLAAVVAIFAVANLPALRNGGFVDPQLERDQDPPQAWLDAAARLDEPTTGQGAGGYRVLQLPGSEFGAFRWGYTVDQPLPGLTERALLTRDLLPLGSPAAMDLVFALDDRFQDGVVDVAAIAPIARLLGVDTIWVADDVAFDRFRVARPEIVDDLLTGDAALDAGLLPAERFGEPTVMVPDVELVDERSVSDRRIGQPLSPVALVGVSDPVPTVRVKDSSVVVSGSADGLVDAAAAGVIDGTELILYSATFDGVELTDMLEQARGLVVTDSNRDRAHHWRSSQDVTGYTEAGGDAPGVLRYESGDQRLPVFETTDPTTQTVSVQDGPVTATASAYGEPFAYLPEHRPVMAIDGDLATSWLVADRAPAIDEFISFEVSEPIDHITLRQPETADGVRRISHVEVRVDGGVDGADPIAVELDERSLVDGGQRIDLDPTDAASTIIVRITGTSTGSVERPPIGDAVGAVGFAEVDFGLEPTTELIRVPSDGVTALDGSSTPPVSYVFTRLRVEPTDRWRSDPEPTMAREFEVAAPSPFDTTVTLRADQRSGDDALAAVLGEPVHANDHLTGVPSARGAAAFDDDAATSWITSFGSPIGAAVNVQLDGTASTMNVTQPIGTFSPITAIRVSDPTGSFDLAVPPEPGATLAFPRPVSLADTTIEITGVDERTTLDRRFGETVVLPGAIAEITFDGVSPAIEPAAEVVADCATDLLSVDGQPIGLSYTATAEQILNGSAIEATVCDAVELGAGSHVLQAAATSTGFDIDQVVLAMPAPPSVATEEPEPPTAELTATSRDSRTVEVSACPSGCWVVLGEGYNTGWSAATEDGSLGEPILVDGNANGWWIEPTTSPTTVTITWAAQPALNMALLASLVGVVIALALAILDRRRGSDADVRAAVPALPGWSAWTADTVGVATIATATVVSALFIGWIWGLVAAAVCVAVRFTRRARLLAATGLGIVVAAQLIVVVVVLRERPYPNAGWPVRFEWLHPWTLLGVVLVATATVFARDATQREATSDA